MVVLDNHIVHADNLNEFERDYLVPMRNRRDKLWNDMQGSPTPEAEKEYDALNSKVKFLENLVNGGRTVVRESGVVVEYCQQFIAAFDEQKPSKIAKAKRVLSELIDTKPVEDFFITLRKCIYDKCGIVLSDDQIKEKFITETRVVNDDSDVSLVHGWFNKGVVEKFITENKKEVTT